MTMQADVTLASEVHTGEYKNLVFVIYEPDGVTPHNIAAFTLSWMLKRNKTDADSKAKITKLLGDGGIVISGIFNVDPLVNTQRVTVKLTRTDTASLPATVTYWHELKRIDSNVETVLSEGRFELHQAVHA
jgi:hypothetical protein